MSNDELLRTVVMDAALASELAQALVHQTQRTGFMLKPEALPGLTKCRLRLEAAHTAARELEMRANK
jgi:hypothetical protein